MAEQNRPPEEESLQAPEKLVAALRQLSKVQIFVPPAVDHAVLRRARKHLRRLERPQSGWKPWLSWAAMAAALALAAWLGEHFSQPTRARPFAREDVNRDGRVDILDAFALARRIDWGGTLDPRWDINGDGRVDGADVNAIAARAVSLAQAGPEQRRGAALNPYQEGGAMVGCFAVSAFHEPELLRVTDPRSGPRLCEAQRFMDPMRAKNGVEALHEPTKLPPAFGQRQSSGALGSGLGMQKRQRTVAVQDAIAAAHPPPRFMVPAHLEEPTRRTQDAFGPGEARL